MNKKVIVVLMIIGLLALSGCSQMVDQYSQPVDPESETMIDFTIPSGASTDKIGELLLEDELIQNKLAFSLMVKELDYDGKLKAGDYKLSQAMSLEEIIEKLYKGDTEENVVKFTIPEGYELREVINHLESKGLIEQDAFIQAIHTVAEEYAILDNVDPQYNYEGFLFPDTYIVAVGASEEAIVRKMFDRFDQIFNEQFRNRLQAIDYDINEVITLASIIEREILLDKERKIASSVFHNRLDINMPLQACATVQYIIEERKVDLTDAETSIDNPYNTYQYGGLPPAPIANPGLKSIEAALYPADTDYLYFVLSAKRDGSHVFSTNLADHNRAKAEYQQQRGD